MDVTGCVADDANVSVEWRLKLREWAARVATLGDLYIWDRKPYFLGTPEPIEFKKRAPIDLILPSLNERFTAP